MLHPRVHVQPAMKRIWITSLLIAAAVWLVMAWPLPSRVLSAIPAGSVPASAQSVVHPMEPGDHLQLLYHFWLFSDALRGDTPWFHNLYEFNTGDDDERFEPGSYYFPFSLFYAAGERLGGPALGWNLAGFLALWFTFLFAWRLARRYTAYEGWAAAAAVLAIAFPYRWINWAGGSPTGFAMMWVPVLLYGLDRAVRDAELRGGIWAGLALLMASWGDTHVFYFSALMTPCWCVAAFAMRASFSWPELRRLAIALLPVPFFAGAALVCSKLITSSIATSRAHTGRTIAEVTLFSPRPAGFFTWAERGVSNHVYFGYSLGLLLVVGLVLFALHARRQKRAAIVFALLMVAVGGICLLALGPFGPFKGRLFTVAREVLPQYTMIRQPAKIFCLLPTVLAVAVALLGDVSSGRARRLLVLLPLLGCLAEFKLRFMPVLCPLDRGQAAYAAVAESGVGKPHALVLPLWPGDSHYTSVYQYYASLHRIRLVNGYRPFPPAHFVENVFNSLESANLGALDDRQFAQLARMGVNHVILHEDLFPEKVSPFPVGATLRNLLNHPRLTLARQSGSVWAFHIEPEEQVRTPLATGWTYLFPSRQYDAQRMKAGGGTTVTRLTRTAPQPDLRWMLRARGPGDVRCETFMDGQPAGSTTLRFPDGTNRWREARIPAFDGPRAFHASLGPAGATIDRILLAAGDWPVLGAGESVRIPAPCFFHAGCTDLGRDSVVIRADRDPHGIVFYGPKLPVPVGRYRVRVDFDSDAPAGTRLGVWIVACPEGSEVQRQEVCAGRSLETEFRIADDLPLLLAFEFNGGGDLSFRSVTLARIE